MRSGQHKSDLFIFIDFIKKTPSSDAIPPCIRAEIFEFFDIWSKMRMLTQLRINEIAQLLSNFSVAGSCDLLKVFFKLSGFEFLVAVLPF